ncbi:MAG: DUF2804 domain-containing protein [bacterium]
MKKPVEKEITSQVALCDSQGRLNADAVGWSRFPLHTCNVKGHWPRKKKWNYWGVMSEKFFFSVTMANIDYIGLASVYFIDFETMKLEEKNVVVPFGAGFDMPELVDRDVSFSNKQINLSFKQDPNGVVIKVEMPSFEGKKLSAEAVITRPAGHETLNVVVPWNTDQFQFTSKQNTMPTAGSVTIGDRKYEFNPESSFAILDYGRGVWPYSTKWNWASCSARKNGKTIGLNLGGMWTDGTGSTENGVCLDGRLYKISEDVRLTYDRSNFMAPWTIVTPDSDTVNLKFTPFFEKKNSMNILFLKVDGHQMFGKFSGTIKTEAGPVEFDNFQGWAEEHISLW